MTKCSSAKDEEELLDDLEEDIQRLIGSGPIASQNEISINGMPQQSVWFVTEFTKQVA
jgi:hypothetical protein